MMILYVISLLLITIFFVIQVLSFIWTMGIGYDDDPKAKWKKLPKVSLLLAARDEEQLIERSLRSIESLNYPKDKLQVLIGNDRSTDQTREKVLAFIKGKKNYHLIDVKENMGKARAKANVIAHLAHKAKGEFYFITDVDVKLAKNWILDLLNSFEDEVGISSGTTMCESGSLFANLQGMDWLHFMGYIKAFAREGISCTSVGNNMAVRAKAYWETGGYEEIDFSITEDYKLFSEVTKRGWEWRNILGPGSLGKAWYIDSIAEMLHQRKRWLIGARDLPVLWKILIVLYGLFIPALLAIAITNFRLAFVIWFCKFALQSMFIFVLCRKVDVRPFNFFQMILYEFYVLLNTAATAIFYMLPIKSIWKGRAYSSKNVSERFVKKT